MICIHRTAHAVWMTVDAHVLVYAYTVYTIDMHRENRSPAEANSAAAAILSEKFAKRAKVATAARGDAGRVPPAGVAQPFPQRAGEQPPVEAEGHHVGGICTYTRAFLARTRFPHI